MNFLNEYLSTQTDLSSWPIFETVLTWFRTGRTSEDPDNLLKGWELIISETETQINKLYQTGIQKTQNELLILRRLSSNVSLKPKITQRTLTLYSKLDSSKVQILLNSRLDSSERLSCLKTSLGTYNTRWFKLLSQFCRLSNVTSQIKQTSVTLNPSILESRWYEQPYLKGVCGEIRTLAFQTFETESSGFTYKICSDVLWSIYLCLSRELVNCLSRGLNGIESDTLLEEVCTFGETLIEIYVQTCKTKGSLSERFGKLPKQWDLDRVHQLEILKTREISARFTDGPGKFRSQIDFRQTASKLESKLVFSSSKHVFRKNPEVPNSIETFRERAAKLETILIFRKTS